MALGTNLSSDIKAVITDFSAGNAPDFYSTGIATAIDSYLAGGVYAAGAFTFTGSITPTDLELNNSGTAISASTAWAEAVENYFKNGVAIPAPANSAPVVVYVALKPALTVSLLAIFSNINNTAQQQADGLASAIEGAIALISATYTITAVTTAVVVPAPAIV